MMILFKSPSQPRDNNQNQKNLRLRNKGFLKPLELDRTNDDAPYLSRTLLLIIYNFTVRTIIQHKLCFDITRPSPIRLGLQICKNINSTKCSLLLLFNTSKGNSKYFFIRHCKLNSVKILFTFC